MEILNKYIKNTFKENLSKLVDLSDGQLLTEDGISFPVHRYALAEKSKYFFALFCGAEKDKKEALIPGIKGETLSNILTYIYTGEIYIATENTRELIIAADYLLLGDLLSQIKTHLAKNLSVANSLAIFTAALKTNCEDILNESLRFIEIHFEDIVHSRKKEFYELSLETLQQLLSDRSLRIRNENVVWLAIVEWVSACLPNRLPHVPDLLLYLAVAELNESLAEQILQHDLLTRNTFCQSICDIKSTHPEFNNLQILQHYIENNSNANLSFHAYRNPSNLHFVVYYDDAREHLHAYVTYDEKLDLWRSVNDHFFTGNFVYRTPHFVFAINDLVCMFDKDESRYFCVFGIIEDKKIKLRDFSCRRIHYVAVKLNRLIYILGGYPNCGPPEGPQVTDVQIYDPKTDAWYDTTPMPPFSSFNAVTLNKFIYVVGNRQFVNGKSLIDEVVVVVYNPDTEVWNELPRPSISVSTSVSPRSSFALAAYHEKLYVIGGINDHGKGVKVFDPASNIWSEAADIPYPYWYPKAVILNDRMIVYGSSEDDRYPLSVTWNVKDECWETTVGVFSDIYLDKYKFFSLEETEYINHVAKENKNAETVFKKVTSFKNNCVPSLQFEDYEVT